MVKLEIKDVRFKYDSTPALKNVSLKLGKGEILGVVGPNASGKTTLLKCINKILKPQAGAVYIEGKKAENLHRKEIARKVGHVPQEKGTSFPTTVFDMVLMGRKPYIDWKPTSKDIEIVTDTIEKLGLEDLAMRDVSELSGGQKQKVVMARALAQEPEILLLDEPTSNLDLKYQLDVLDIAEKQTNNGVSILLAIHDLNLAAKYSDKILILKNGEIYAAGGTEILNPENIEPVYNVKIDMVNQNGRRIILPKSSNE